MKVWVLGEGKESRAGAAEEGVTNRETRIGQGRIQDRSQVVDQSQILKDFVGDVVMEGFKYLGSLIDFFAYAHQHLCKWGKTIGYPPWKWRPTAGPLHWSRRKLRQV